MIRAVINDTWQQSKQQGVFLFMLALMTLVLIVGIALPRDVVTADNQKHFGTLLSARPVNYFERQWVNAYAATLDGESQASRLESLRVTITDDSLSREERAQQMRGFAEQQQKLRDEAVTKATDVPEYQRAVEYYIHFVVDGMFTATMLLFIAACAGYFPAMLSSGAVDIVLSKPLSRLQIYLGKYLGGITLYTAALIAFNVILFVGIGLRTNVWHARIFYSIPLLVFSAMVLYALLALIGTLTKSATMSLVLGYVFYIVVDSLVGALVTIQPALVAMGWSTAPQFNNVLKHVLPNFGMMNDMALTSLLNMPTFEVAPFLVALAWLVACLGLGYWTFKQRDY